jgi:hypothetical protein
MIMDRDRSSLAQETRDFRQVTASSFGALCEDLAELRMQVEAGFKEMRGKFDAAAAGQQESIDLLITLNGWQRDGPPGETDRGAVGAS